MKVVLLITALVGWLYTPAQDTQLHSPLAPGKGRLVVLFTVQSDNFSRPQQQDLISGRYPVFFNNQLLCRMQYLTYTIHDVDTGNHVMATQFNGKKLRANASKTPATITSNKISYLEIFFDVSKGVNGYQIMPISKILADDLLRKLMPVNDCKVD
ncbi:MAG: hypothetical protein EAY68_06020 [Bacteroidetes bacterium]|nr:MAG: hypothetical protein EAY68_06020 [Bacteroidota bacterium]